MEDRYTNQCGERVAIRNMRKTYRTEKNGEGFV
jgi:hypothetical protein